MGEPKLTDKPFEISKWVVWEAFEKVEANQGAAGVDGESIAEFERNLVGNLYKLWNRMSSGTYFPPPVREVEMPEAEGKGVRVLGGPQCRTGLPRRSCGRIWSRRWSRCSTRTPTATGRGGLRSTR